MTALGWAATLAVITSLFAFDLLVVPHRSAAPTFREAAGWSILYVTVALAFGLALAVGAGWRVGTEYLAGYLVEKSLSVDNLFVFVIIIGAFAVPISHRSRALTTGILIALILRAVLIGAGASLLNAFSFMFLIFGLALLFTAVQLFRHHDQDPSIDDNPIVTAARRSLPISRDYDGDRLLTRSYGRRMLTPMFLVLIAIGTTDLLFALDSIPAVFGVTSNAYVVFSANAFALLGLRPLFFLVTGLLRRLVHLSIGLSVILALIGVKLILHFGHLHAAAIPEISTGASLAAIVVVLAVTTIASLRRTRKDPTAVAHAGSIRSRAPSPRDGQAPARPPLPRGGSHRLEPE